MTMSKDKYARILSRQLEAIVFIILQIFFATSAVFNSDIPPVLLGNIQSRDTLRLITREEKYSIDYNY